MKKQFSAAILVSVLAVARGHGADSMSSPAEWAAETEAGFRGEPVEAFGPLALFRTSSISIKALPMHVLPADDCVRFYRAIASKAPRADRWSDAQGAATREMRGSLLRFTPTGVSPADLSEQPEPELLLLLLGAPSRPNSRWLFDNIGPFADRVRLLYGERIASVVVTSLRDSASVAKLPTRRDWLVVNPDEQWSMELLSHFMPAEGLALLLMTREGVPLVGAAVESIDDVMKFVDEAGVVLWQCNPANPGTVADRVHYGRIVRPLEFAHGSAAPALLVDPFKQDALREFGIRRIEARAAVGSDGAVTELQILPGSDIPADLVAPLAESFRRNARFLPAIETGKEVPGTFRYSLDVGPADPARAAAAAWVNGEARVDIPLKSWLVLKPIHVLEEFFGRGIDHIATDGTVVLAPVKANKSNEISALAQLNAFSSDWFAPNGPGDVRPVEGAKQEADGEKLTWRRMSAHNGYVDLLPGNGDQDFCIGYAWTEFEVPADVDAWLGIGSDDGLIVWLNGRQVHSNWVQRRSFLDDDVVPLHLKKGKNQILLKIQNAHGYWNFTCRLRVRRT